MSAHETGWKVYSLRTITGEVGSELDPVSGSWSVELNKVEDFSVTVKKNDLLRRERLWWFPWSGGVLFTYTGEDGIENPIVAGPIVDYGTETSDELSFSCGGIRKILEHRTIWQTLEYRSMTYGDIAWSLVQHGLDRPGGGLPIVRDFPSETGRYERTYEGWNLANNGIDKRLTELSEVINGPDIMFRPRWVDGSNHQKIEWVMVHGTALSTSIPQTSTPDFDMTSAASDVLEPSIKSSGTRIRQRVWCTGAGEGEGVARAFAQDLTTIENEYSIPFLEDVISDADQNKEYVLRAKAEGALRAQSQIIDQLTFKSYTHSSKNQLGSFNVGDTANITMRGWINIPDGTRSMKLLKMNGDFSDVVTLDFQEGVW